MNTREQGSDHLLQEIEADEAMEAVIVEYLEEKRGGTLPAVTIASGGVIWSCVRHDPEKAKPKSKS